MFPQRNNFDRARSDGVGGGGGGGNGGALGSEPKKIILS